MSSSAEDMLSGLAGEAKVPPPLAKVKPSAPPNKPTDSLGDEYMDHRNTLEGKAALEELQSGQPPQKPPETPQGQKDAPKGDGIIYDPKLRLYKPDPNLAAGPGVAAVAKDVGTGVLESPRAVYKGAHDAAQSYIHGVTDLGDWLTEKGNLPGLSWKGGQLKIVSGKDATTDALGGKPEVPGDVDAPKSVTGGLLKSASQFITSVAGAGRALGLLAPEGEIAQKLLSMGKGAAAMFAGFEGSQGRLSDLIQKVPALQNPITDFLSSKPDDNEAVGRLKNALEGTGLGLVQDGLLHALRTFKGATDAKAELAGVPETPPEAPPPKNAFSILGDATAVNEPLVQSSASDQWMKSSKLRQAQIDTYGDTPESITQGATPEPKTFINFARIDTPEDVHTAMQQMADAQKTNIDAARRGVQSFEDTKLGANSVNAWDTLMSRRQGQPLGDQEMLAARQLWQQSAVKTAEVMEEATANPTPENLLAFRKQWQTHAMIQKEVIAARTETARSLSAMRIPVGQGDAERLSSVVNQLNQMGGLSSNLDFLQKAKALADAGDLEAMGNVAEKSTYAKTRDALLDAWTNGLLTSPMTHVKVNLSNIATMGLRLTETRIAESLDKVMGNQNGVVAGEAAQTAAGLISGIKDSFKYAGKLAGLNIEAPEQNPITDAVKAFKEGQYSVGESRPDWVQSPQGNISAEALGFADSGWLGNGIDMLGQIVRTPGRALTGEHEFYRSLGMRMELNRYAIRQATAEVNAGRLDSKDFAGRIAELVENPPHSISSAAVNGMTYQTFTDAPGKLAELIQQLRYNFPATRVILPFYKIPSRILSFTFERSPIAPLMSSFRENIAAGGARASLAKAQMGLGTMVMLAAGDAVMSGAITGSGPVGPGERQNLENQGWMPYSVKTPSGRWVQYNKLETVGSSMAMAADVAQTIKNYHTAVNSTDQDVDLEKVSVAAALAIAQNVTSKTYLQGLANFFELMDNKRSTEGVRPLQSLAASVVPAGAGTVERATDPYNREVNSMLDAIKARTPGLSKSLPPMRNLWGEPVSHESGFGKLYDAFVPFGTREPKSEPIDVEMQRLGMNEPLPPAKASFGGVNVNIGTDPKLYSRYVELAGNELKHPAWGTGAKDTLNDLVSGNHPLSALYNMKSDGINGGKAEMVKGIIDEFRGLARKQLLDESPELAAKVDQLHEQKQALKAFQ